MFKSKGARKGERSGGNSGDAGAGSDANGRARSGATDVVGQRSPVSQYDLVNPANIAANYSHLPQSSFLLLLSSLAREHIWALAVNLTTEGRLGLPNQCVVLSHLNNTILCKPIRVFLKGGLGVAWMEIESYLIRLVYSVGVTL